MDEYDPQLAHLIRRRAARRRATRHLSQTHGVCMRCGCAIQRGESYGVNGDGHYHLRDCQKWTLETGKRYNFIESFGLMGETVRMAK